MYQVPVDLLGIASRCKNSNGYLYIFLFSLNEIKSNTIQNFRVLKNFSFIKKALLVSYCEKGVRRANVTGLGRKKEH